VASLSQGRTAAAQCGLFTYKSVPVIFEPPCTKLKGMNYKNSTRVYRWMHKKTMFVTISRVIAAKIGQERNKRSGCSKHK